MPLRSRITQVAFKIESTPGTAEALTAADAAFISYNARLERDVPVDQRPGGTGFQQHAAIHGPRMGRITWEEDLVGSGADGTPAHFQTVMTCCGHDLTGDVLACGITTRTATIGIFRDGIREGLIGAVGTYQITLNAGRAARIAFTFTGKLAADADAAALAPTYPTVIPPRWAGGSCSIHSLAVKASTLTLDRGAEVVMREDPADPTGFAAAHFVDASPFITLDPESDLVAVKNWQAAMEAHTEGAVSVALGTASGNTLTLASATAQVTECPNDERNKLVTRALRLQLNGSAAFTLTQS
jgi:hypothetical protein